MYTRVMMRAAAAVILVVIGLLLGRLIYEPKSEGPANEAGAVANEAPTPMPRTELIDRAKQSIALIRMRGVKGTSTGTAFRAREDSYFVTNFHVLEGSTEGTIQTQDGPASGCAITKVAAYDRAADWAIIRAPGCDGPAFQRAPAGALRQGMSILVVGNPLGRERTASEGIISNIISENGGTTVMHTAASDPGSSGSPVLDQWGKVIGIHQGLDKARSFRSLIPMDVVPTLESPPDGISLAEFGRRFPPEITLARLRQILSEDARNLSEWIEAAEQRRSDLQFPPTQRRQQISEISGATCREDSALPSQAIQLLSAEAEFEDGLKAEIEIDREKADVAIRLSRNPRDSEAVEATKRETELLFRKFALQYIETSQILDAIASREQSIGSSRGRELVLDKYLRYVEVRRQTSAALRTLISRN